MPNDPVKRIVRGREYIQHPDGTSQTRRLDSSGTPISPWTTVEAPPPVDQPDPEQGIHLSVIAEHQAQDEPKHWFLFVHRPDTSDRGQGEVWQVTGDAEHMVYEQFGGVDAFASDCYAWHQLVNGALTEGQLETLDRIARFETPPSAPNRASVRENCQGWVLRVLAKLVEEGIAEERVVTMLRGYLDPV